MYALPPTCSAAYTIYDSMYVWMDEAASDSYVHEQRRTGGAFWLHCTHCILSYDAACVSEEGPQHPQTNRQTGAATFACLLPTSEEMADGWTR